MPIQPKPPKFKVGDKVVLVNEFGGNYGVKTITEVIEKEKVATTYKITPEDPPHFPVSERWLYPINSPLINERTKFIGTS